MANKHNSLSHTKWLCKYHIVFTPKYRRKIEYNQYKRDIVNIIQRLCKYNRIFERKKFIMIFDMHSNWNISMEIESFEQKDII